MPSDLPHLGPQLQPQPLLQQTTLTTNDFRGELHQLDVTAQTLKADKAVLETQLKALRDRIAANDNQIRRTMKNLDKQLFHDQRGDRQPAFQHSILEDDNVIEGIWTQMQLSPQLQKALQAIVKEEGTLAHNNIVSSAIMTELTGNTFQFVHDIAARVLEFDPNRATAAEAVAQSPIIDAQPNIDPTLPATEPIIVDTATEAARDPSVIPLSEGRGSSIIPLLSPSIKSETVSIATPYNVANSLPALATVVLNNTSTTVAASVEGTPVRQVTPGNIVAHGMTTLQKNFPGLLESLNTTPTIRPKLTTTKRGRESVETEASPSPSMARAGKKTKHDKEPAISHTFIMYMKQLEQLHRSGKPIANNIRCSRCQQIKRDVRVLNCLHMYCHRCVLQLRGQAQHGNAITGFQSSCVKPGCKQVVSGKTTVIDSEIIEFLQWYDTQSPAVASITAQLHVLNTATAKYPEDGGIKAKLQQVQSQFRAMQVSATGDAMCDLMQIAKLARKPYLT